MFKDSSILTQLKVQVYCMCTKSDCFGNINDHMYKNL